MPFAILLALAAVSGGTLLTYLYDREASPLVRVCEGLCTGFAALGLVGFIIASFAGLQPAALVAAGLFVASPLILLRKAEWRARVRVDAREASRTLGRAITFRSGGATFVFYAAAAVLCWLVFRQAMYAGADGIFTGLDNNIGDLPFHVGIISGFVHGDNFPPEHPEFAGTRLTYPFLADFLTAMFVRAGASLEGAMFWQNFTLALSFVALLGRWAALVTGERAAGFLAPALVLFNGGLGFLQVFGEAARGGGLLHTLGNPTVYYTMMGDTYKWGNFVTMLLVPQRGLLLGFPLAIIVLTLWWQATSGEKGEGVKGKGEEGRGKREHREAATRKGEATKKGKRNVSSSDARAKSSAAAAQLTHSTPFPLTLSPFPFRQMLAAGVIAGLMPLVHAHSFVVLMGMGGCLALLLSWRGARDAVARGEVGKEAGAGWRGWFVFFAAATVVAAPQMLWATYRSDVQAGSFFGWQLGWDRGTLNPIVFWLKNTGLFIPLLVAALAWRGQKPLVSRRLLVFYLPFTLCFVVPNLLKMSPWIWDNIKILFYWWVASAPIVALLIVRLWRRGGAWRAAAAVSVVVLTLAGALDVWRVASGGMRQPVFTREGVEFAEMLKRETPPRSLVLHAPTYNHPVYLTGRRSLMGYAGHLGSHGIDYTERERDFARIFSGGPEAEALLKQYGVDYVVVGPLERRGGEMARIRAVVNETFFQRYTKVGQTGGYSLYKTSP
ncbi:MAG TPA: hypothetical protein VF240_12210 [Pyrinomonadaceae bacterium]